MTTWTLFERRGRREDRAPAGTHGPRATKKHAAEPQVQPKTSGLPCAMVLRLIRALPGDQALLSPSSTDRSIDLTPAQGRQDHTTSPSASCCSSHSTSRPSHPALNVRDDRDTPLVWARDARMVVLICPTTQGKMCTTGSLRMGLCVQVSPRHCEPPGPRVARPDDRLREAIQTLSADAAWIASSLTLLAMTAEIVCRMGKAKACPPPRPCMPIDGGHRASRLCPPYA
jgi:hypothetical protein